MLFFKGVKMENNGLRNGILSFIIPGLGQVLNGDTAKGIGLFAAVIALNLFTYYVLNNPFGHLINVAYRLYAGYDAYKTS